MGPKSEAWKHFIPSEDKKGATCNFCKKFLSVRNGSSSSLLRHLRSKHREELQESPSTTSDDSEKIIFEDLPKIEFLEAEIADIINPLEVAEGAFDDTEPLNMDLINENILNDDVYKYTCHHCEIAFKCRILYRLHMGHHNRETPFKCNICGLLTNDKISFFLHMACSVDS